MKDFDSRKFRNALGRYPTGVAIITARRDDGLPIGMTVNSFASVSLDPPSVLWSIDETSAFFDVFMNTEYFAVHLLRADQRQLSQDFSNEDPAHFANIEHDNGIEGLPLLPTYSALFQCRLIKRHIEGDHVVLIGRVLDLQNHSEEPLVFFAGNYHRIED